MPRIPPPYRPLSLVDSVKNCLIAPSFSVCQADMPRRLACMTRASGSGTTTFGATLLDPHVPGSSGLFPNLTIAPDIGQLGTEAQIVPQRRQNIGPFVHRVGKALFERVLELGVFEGPV